MKAKLVFLFVFVVFLVINLSAQNQATRKSAADAYPWQQESSRKADKSRAYYEKKAKKAIKEAKEISASKKVSPKSHRPKSQKAYEKKYLKDAKKAGINIKKNRRNS